MQETLAKTPVHVSGGRITGVAEGNIRAYRGIPYASPPIGDLRWRPPAPVVPWQGVRACEQFGADCPQTPYPEGSLYAWQSGNMSEDCLFLNVWTGARDPEEQRPVIVWIHGGALTRGTSAREHFNGTMFARQGVVLISINYRLGPLGYLAHPELSAESTHGTSGNYGMLDQIAALEWVKENCAQFGGDPKRVTILGESAGAWSVSALMASPLARGLFHRAIAQSGGLLDPNRMLDRDHGSLKSAHDQGCAFLALAGKKNIEELRQVDALTLMKLADSKAGYRAFTTMPVVDGYVLKEQIYTTFAAGRQAPVPVLVGSNANEGSVFPEFVPQTALDLTAHLKRKYAPFEEQFKEIYPFSNDRDAVEAGENIFRDAIFTWPMRTWARSTWQTGQRAWRYFFEVSPPIFERKKYGAYHAAEIPYVFGTLDVMNFSREEDQMISQHMSTYWANFARTGNPNGGGLPFWPAYEDGDETILVFGESISPDREILDEECDLIDLWQAHVRTQAERG